MPKKIKNPLREGLPSKIYLLAYGDHLSGYEIAGKIYGTRKPSDFIKGQIPPTAKVYGWLKRLEMNKLVSIKKGGKKKSYVTSEVDPLIDEVEKELKGYKLELSDFEKYVLGKVLDSDIFREWIKEIAESLSFEHDIDAVNTIMSPVFRTALIVSMISRKFSIPLTSNFFLKNKLSETRQDFDEVWSGLIREIDRSGEKVHERSIKMEPGLPKDFSMRDARRFALFVVMPDSLLQKLARPSDPVDRAVVYTIMNVPSLPKIFTKKGSPKALGKLFRTLEKE